MNPYSQMFVVQGDTGRCLLDFAVWFASEFGIAELSEGSSSNYPEGWYFDGVRDGMRFTVSVVDQDDYGVGQYRFQVVGESDDPRESGSAALQQLHQFAQGLAARGYTAFVVAEGIHAGPKPLVGIAYGA